MGHQPPSAGGSRRLAMLLLAVTVPPAAALVWLGVQVAIQDRSLLAQRDFERRQAATDAVVRSLQASIADAERHGAGESIPAGMVRLTVDADGIRAEPSDRVAWLPVSRSRTLDSDDPTFAQAERLEFQGDADRAAAAYTALAASPNPAIRAGALLRLARVRRAQHRWDEALRTYRDLARTGAAVDIDGTPADLEARRAICALLVEANRTRELVDEAGALERDLLAGRWPLDRAAWQLTVDDVKQWLGRPVVMAPDREAFSAAADAIWTDAPGAKPRVVVANRNPMTVLWPTAAHGRTTAIVISLTVLREWIDRATAGPLGAGARLDLVDASGDLLFGPRLGTDVSATKMAASDTGLPWTLVVHTESTSTAVDLANRRRLLLAALGAILLLLCGGTCVLWRVVRHELAVARLQSEFVAAVSHEFRTPLTSLRHVAQLLEEDDLMPPERRIAFYQTLGRNTERLHRLVESLLDFGRMESGRKPYDMRPRDIADLVERVAADFRNTAPGDVHLEMDAQIPHGVGVRADTEALTSALWNLLDNAVKYSPDRPAAVSILVHPHPLGVGISIRDEGVGIPLREQKEIFGRFVRGARATELGIKGTGLGLAMVSHIVRAHGGRIELTSEEDAGSTFTVALPTEPRQARSPAATLTPSSL